METVLGLPVAHQDAATPVQAVSAIRKTIISPPGVTVRSFIMDPCNPENDIYDLDPIGPDDYNIPAPPFITSCGVNFSSQHIRYFETSGPNTCNQCGFDERRAVQYQDCGG